MDGVVNKSSVDFLLEPQTRGSSQAPPLQTPPDALVDRAASLFGGQLLNALRQAPNQSLRAFDLVDLTQMNIQSLHQVLDAFASSRYGWVVLDKDDPKGNYSVRLSEYGKKYLDSLMAAT
jgi:hypothetical protein